jgi:N,N'-diacetyllegionaminate synthase
MRIPYIIAEAGSCHEGDLERANELVFLAARAGADAVKFQYWSSPARMRERRHMEGDAYTRGSIEAEWFKTLWMQAKSHGLHFLCTAYLPEDIPLVERWVDAFKVSSFEATRKFVDLLRPYGKTIYVSMGMGGLRGAPPVDSNIEYLHCVSAYPCPVEEADVGAVQYRDGYSDHTRNVLTGAVAVGAGARVLEVHFRLDDTSPDCPDYCVSLSPEELRTYIANARLAQVLRGDGAPRVMPSEAGNVKHRVREEP